MKKILLLILIGLLASCEQAVVEDMHVVEPVRDSEIADIINEEPIVEEVVEDFSEMFLSLEEYRLAPDVCRIPSLEGQRMMSGFPMSPDRITSIGTVKAKVVYLDFLDYQLQEEGDVLKERFLALGNDINEYFFTNSYGKLMFDWDVHPVPLLMPKTVKDYELTIADYREGYYPTLEIVYQMLELHRNEVDFTDVELIVVMFNPNVPFEYADVSPAHPVGRSHAFVTEQGDILNAVTIASDWKDHEWEKIAHEIGHTLGLLDLYDHEITGNWYDHHRHVGGFDIMGTLNQKNIELFGWNRYLMGWIDDSLILCLDTPSTPVLIPLHSISSDAIQSSSFKMIVIPIGSHEVLIIEAKEQNNFCLTCDGLLVYLVDSRIDGGRGSFKLLPINRSVDKMKNDAMIRINETFQTHSLQISLLRTSSSVYVVELTRVE